ncbi:hyaluronan-binding protein 2-like [Anopheles stephensi]|uniref:hyaluronan-binding protein 2-like n=1 Tax=Anopheles stephensi TaxID=30069 RepID=UPI001658928A|nr:hyaluronan-binding protein 2-like [Anopheles stephensi]
MWSLGNANRSHLRILLAVAVAFSCAGQSLACSCVPVNLCPSQELDLQMADKDGLICPAGKVCCDAPVVEKPTSLLDELDETPCDGVCVTNALECAGEIDNDESGKDFIDVRNYGASSSCPADQYCCRTGADEAAICDGTCQPWLLCIMPLTLEGCSEGNVCCYVESTPAMETIYDINAMADPDPGFDRDSACAWRKLREDGNRLPPWLVSVWARVEIIAGIQIDQFVCSGVLVDSSLVLTTASNVKNVPAEKMFVNVGDYDISSRSALKMQNIYTVKQQIIYDDYNETSGLVHNDVAMLRLTTPVRNGQCVASLSSSPEAPDSSCYTFGWNRTLLTAGSGRPVRYPVQLTSFLDDPYCVAGAICLARDDEGRCNYDALDGSPIVCRKGETEADWRLRGLLASNCSGVPARGVTAWLEHQRNPGFVQEVKPSIPDRQYLPVL